MTNRIPLLAILMAALAAPFAAADTSSPTPFSRMTDLNDGWEPLEFPRIERHSRYQLVQDGAAQVVRGHTNDSASGLIARLRVEPGDQLLLRWRWKVSGVYEQGDARSKDGDDYPARIYVAFEFQPDQASFFERLKRGTVETLFGEELPGNALNYIWANRLAEGEFVANPYTDRTMMVAVNSGADDAGRWVTVERDIVADYRQAFGEAPPPIVGIGIMSDSDNTGEEAVAWYGDIELVQP